MPQGRLNEGYVQEAAVDWLTSHYQSQPGIQAVVSKTEAWVSLRDKLGRGCADGLIAAQQSDGTIYTASLEAKSSRTRINIKPRYLDSKWFLHSVLVGGVGLILTGFIGWSISDRWFWKWIFPLLMFLVVSFVYLMLT